MNYTQAKARADALNAAHVAACEPMAAFPKGAMGMTPDAVRNTTEWRNAYAAERRAFAELRAFNAWYVKAFRAERNAERSQRLAAGLRPW